MFEWTEDECLQLIELYKTKALLWDPKHPNYFKKSLKEESWREIACELGSYRSDVDCKNKIVSLLSSHRREKNKTKQSQSTRKGKVCFFTYSIFNNNILHSVYSYVLYNLIQNRLKEWNTLENIVDGLWAGAGGSQKSRYLYYVYFNFNKIIRNLCFILTYLFVVTYFVTIRSRIFVVILEYS